MQLYLLKHQRSGNSVSVHVCVVKQGVEDGEERVAQQQSLFHGRTSQRAESCGILGLETGLQSHTGERDGLHRSLLLYQLSTACILDEGGAALPACRWRCGCV